MSRNNDAFDEFAELDDIVIYQDERIRLCQDFLGHTYYQGKCTQCDAWYDIEFDNIIHTIKGAKVGDPLEPILVEYPYRVSVVLSSCNGCAYIHVHDANDYTEMVNFKASDATEICRYKNYTGIYNQITYNIFSAELIAKYLLGFVAQSILLLGHEAEYFDLIKDILIQNEVMDVCLVGVMLVSLIDSGECKERNLDEWFQKGKDFLTEEQIQDWGIVATLLL